MQPNLDPGHCPGELIHADLNGEEFDREWDKLPLNLRLPMTIGAPIFGLYAKYLKTEAKFFEYATLGLQESRSEILGFNPIFQKLDSLILERRDDYLISCVD